jgi:putative PEP-CTERM system histidine kinase
MAGFWGMDLSIGLLSYGIAAFAFLVFSLLLLTSWRGRAEGAYLVAAVLVSCLWALSSLLFTLHDNLVTSSLYLSFEVLKNVAWFLFLFRLLKNLRRSGGESDHFFSYVSPLVYLLSLLLFVLDVVTGIAPMNVPWQDSAQLQLIGHLGLAVTGLALIEQLFRHTRPERRWEVKFLYFGIGIIFVYDFFLYADGLLFKQVDASLWEARGFISVIVVPLVAVAASRNPSWSIEIFVSRHVVFHATTFIGAGIYLLVMSGVGYYINYYGGSWGKSAQIIFLLFTVVLLVAILASGTFRSRIKIFLSKHFFKNKYDYREEWLRFIQTLSNEDQTSQVKERVVKAVADLMESRGGLLWLREERDKFLCASSWMVPRSDTVIKADTPLVTYLAEKDWIVDFHELQESPGLYGELSLPDELSASDRHWLLVPIKYQVDLIGFIVLLQPPAPRQINWEDRDLLKTVANQVGSYLALMQASEALSRANQFEAFNRLSAFVVHDLKNVLAQLELLVRNAQRHRDNPAFMEDAIKTVDNAAKKMGRLLDQLRKGRFEASGARLFRLGEAIRQAVQVHAGYQPVPELSILDEEMQVVADRDRFTAVIGHMIKNAQEATPEDGHVRVKLGRGDGYAEISIEDNGAGMETEFIRDRLFQPFETTKGNAGMGVGVYESREFIRALGGDIEVESQVGKGTRFTLSIPVGNPLQDFEPHTPTDEMELQH